MKEYLGVLMPLLRGGSAYFDGQEYSVRGVQFSVPEAKDVPVVIAALGSQILKLAADMVDGTNTWMVGPNTMEQHILKAFEDAGKSNPTIVAGLPIVLTNNIDAARESIAKNLTVYGRLPSYRAVLDREGVEGPADLALVGDENQLFGQIKRFADMGVTDFNAIIMGVEEGAHDRTLEFLGSLKT